MEPLTAVVQNISGSAIEAIAVYVRGSSYKENSELFWSVIRLEHAPLIQIRAEGIKGRQRDRYISLLVVVTRANCQRLIKLT